MIAVDSSVVVAAFGGWHEQHKPARAVLSSRPMLPVHAGLESYSVLTRLPEPFRAAPETVAEYLARTFGERPLTLGAAEQAALPTRLARLGISGGAVYDALIAVTAAAAGARLCTLDQRALVNYRRCEVAAELLG